MVIQRNWKISVENLQHPNNSDDSNGSSQTISSTNTNSSKSQNNKFVTTSQMADNVLSRLKQRFGTQVTGQKSSSEAVMRSLELLRINIQSAFDKEIDGVLIKFMEMYFKPAFKNIKENLGDHVVSDDVLQKMSCALLENSKTQYNKKKLEIITSTTLLETTKSDGGNLLLSNLKRPSNEALKLDVPSQVNKKSLLQFQEQQSQPNIQQKNQQYNVNVQQQETQQQPQQQPRRQIFWNTSNISIETQFLLDVQANQAFGFGTDGKVRLASKHPELIRYLPDGQDRDWLVQQKIIPSQNRNSRFLFLVYDEVIKLGTSEQYRHKENLDLQILHAFCIPHFIIQKMKTFFIDLNMKSHGLITNSYTVLTGSSHLRNALLQGSHLSTSAHGHNNASTSSSLTTLQGTQTINNSNNNNNNNNNNNSNNNNNGINGTKDILTSQVNNISKPKSSLSSSHATLTALLTSNSDIHQNNADGNN